MRCVRFDHVTSFIVNPDDTPVTIIEIRRFRNGWKCFEAPGVEPVFLDQEQAIDYAKNCACFVMMGEPVQFELHEREQFLQRSLVSAAPVAEQLGDLSSRGWGRRQYKLLDAANSSMVEGFLQHGRRAIKKNCALVAGFRRPFRFGR
ncbi:MAG: hypothetical protein DMF26_08430 [Verrucomicrobia bacterium]|nr:MAG: hypothetical protein DMF26_08430 [Verrucomicrobiota bacterium]